MSTPFGVAEEPIVQKRKGCYLSYGRLAVIAVILLVLIILVVLLAAFFGPGRKRSNSEESDKDQHEGMMQSTEFSCDVVIVGGGISGLYVAETLLRIKKETDVCLFEREDRFGGRIHDYRFGRAPGIPISLGAWRLDDSFSIIREIIQRFNISYDFLAKDNRDRIESRGFFATDVESLKNKVYSTLNDGMFQNYTYTQLMSYLLSKMDQASNFSTFSSFASAILTPEGFNFFVDVIQFQPDYSRESNAEFIGEFFQALAPLKFKFLKPVKGISILTDSLRFSASKHGAKLYNNEEVKFIRENEEGYLKLTTKNFTVTAKKLVVAVPVAPMKQIRGEITEKIQSDPKFKSVGIQVAFKGFALYEEAWWQRNSTGSRHLADEQRMLSNSDCLGAIFPYKQRGPRGEAILQTAYASYNCGVKWGKLLAISKEKTDEEIHRALQRLFPGVSIPKPLDTKYIFWEEGHMHTQKAGIHIPMTNVEDWAKRPLPGKDVFLVGEAYHPMRGWTEGALLSAQNALQEGWNMKFEHSSQKRRALNKKRFNDAFLFYDMF